MLEGLYFWKKKSGTTSLLQVMGWLLIMIVLSGGAGAGYWYYFIKLPADEMKAQQQQAAHQLRKDIDSEQDRYAKSLEGVSIDYALRLLDEIHRNILSLSLIRLPAEDLGYNCSMKLCSMHFELQSGAILTQPSLTFFGKTYLASFPVGKGKNKKDALSLEYKDMKFSIPNHDGLKAYKANKPLELPACNDVISYIKTYNSVIASGKSRKKNGEIVFKSLPKSPVGDLEKRLTGQVKSYGMLSSDWSIEVSGTGGQYGSSKFLAQLALYKQAYRDAFLIRKIETVKDGIKISGGLVCKA